MGAKVLRAVNANRASLPKCGARAKSTGEPCKQTPAKGRTRCKFHGGATPKGPGPLGWHTPACPGGAPTGKPRSDAYKQRRRHEAAARVEAMTPEQRAGYEAWRASHAPGSPAKRHRRRQDREAARWLQDLMSRPHPALVDVPERPKPPRPVAKLPSLARAMRERIGVFE